MQGQTAPTTTNPVSASELLRTDLPFLRRYARALTGSQTSGDAYALATLEAIVDNPNILNDKGNNPRVMLYQLFHGIWESSGAPIDTETGASSTPAERHLLSLTPKSREALLLTTIEEFSVAQCATIMQLDESEVYFLLDSARKEMETSTTGKILIIEDEAIISLDLQEIVTHLGHTLVGVARTHAEAVALAAKDLPDLILSDIQLADNSSGIDAVAEILTKTNDIPVVFITAFPARLLTSERPEPAFLITKPYRESHVRAAISQAMLLASTKKNRPLP